MNDNSAQQAIIPVYQFQFTYKVQAAVRLPVYAGSAWRGAFGHALKKTVCVVRNTPCQQCMLKTSCAYSYLFETPPPENTQKMRKYNASPHPFVLQFPLNRSTDPQHYRLNMLVFGHGQRFFPYITHAMKKAGEDGIGSQRQKFELETIDQLTENQHHLIYQQGKLSNLEKGDGFKMAKLPEKINIRIHTPLRIKQQGHNLNPENFNFSALFGNLLRRISMLSYFHTDTALETDFADLTHRARQIEFTQKQLTWYDWKRYSSRQKTEMNMGGVVGTLQLDGKGMEDFWPYLWLGQWTHAGKATSMGMGHYSIETTSLSGLK